MRKLSLLVLSLIVFLRFPVTVFSQTEIRFSEVRVDILPEYDHPDVLVIYHITLDPTTSLPANLSIKIPVNSQINAVAIMDPSMGLLNTPFEQNYDGEWIYVSFVANSGTVQLEYYVELQKSNFSRNLSFQWMGDYATEKLLINFVTPHGTRDLTIVPPASFTGFDSDGLANYQIQTFNLGLGQSYIVSMSYQRTTDELEIASLPIQALSSPGLETPGRVSITGVLPWVLGALGIILVAIGVIGFIVWQREGRGGEPFRKKRKKETRNVTYCRECGKRSQAGDTYCRSCGTRL